jgi:hypothetical protein
MATPDEVRASLLASGDHSRDGCARRKLADRVRETVETGLKSVQTSHADVATAASAVVLASGLRAPAETRAEFVDRLTENVKAGKVRMVDASDSPFRVPHGAGASGEGNPGLDGIVQAANHYGVNDQVGEAIAYAQLLQRRRVSPNRQGWRARLANVERLLGEAMNATGTSSLTHKKVAEAAAEIRAMIDGDGE